MRTTLRTLVVLGVCAALVLGLAACTRPSSEDPSALEGTWKLESFGGSTAPMPADPTVTTRLTLQAGQASGYGGVNSFNSTYQVNGAELKFSPVVSAKMAGPENAMAQEAKFFLALEKTERWEVKGTKLILSNAGKQMLAVLDKQ